MPRVKKGAAMAEHRTFQCPFCLLFWHNGCDSGGEILADKDKFPELQTVAQSLQPAMQSLPTFILSKLSGNARTDGVDCA